MRPPVRPTRRRRSDRPGSEIIQPGTERDGDLELGLERPGGEQARLEMRVGGLGVAALERAPAERPLELGLEDARRRLAPDPGERLAGDRLGLLRAPGEREALGDPRPGLVHVAAGTDPLESIGRIREDGQTVLVSPGARGHAPEVAGRERDAELVPAAPQTRSASRRSASASAKRPWSDRISASLFDWVATLATRPARVLAALLRA